MDSKPECRLIAFIPVPQPTGEPTVNHTHTLGNEAEDLAEELLKDRDYQVVNLNKERSQNYKTVDLEAGKAGERFRVSVKARSRKWHIALGQQRSLEQLRDDDWVVAFIPDEHGQLIDLPGGTYRTLVIPGGVAREKGLEMQRLYENTPLKHGPRKGMTPSGNFGVVVKFDHWVGHELFLQLLKDYEDRWDLLPGGSIQ